MSPPEPPLLPALLPGAQPVARKAVLAQLAQDPTDEHFPLLINEAETVTDFTLSTRFKTVRGVVERFGWGVEDLGAAEAARAIEPLCMLWCIPGFLRNDWMHAFKVLRP